MNSSGISDLLEFPCIHEFKAFGPNDGEDGFVRRVRDAVTETVPIDSDAIKQRPSSRGTYQSVSVMVRLHDEGQLKSIYAALKDIADLKFIL